jgi:hypothetical protein
MPREYHVVCLLVPLSISFTSLPDAALAVAYTGQAAATYGIPPYTYSKTTGPSWLSVNSSTGAITGTPDAIGTGVTVTILVTDASGSTASVTDTIDVTEVDAYYSNVVFLTNFNSGSALDTKGHTISLVADAAVTTTQPQPGGTHSLALDIVGDLATSADSADWDFGTGDFTLEWDAYHTDFTLATGGTNQCPLSRNLSAWAVLVGHNLGTLIWYRSGVQATTSNMMTIAAWNHCAISRVSGTTRIFINGVKGAEFADSTSYNYATPLVLGASDTTPFGNLKGYVGNYRITKGTGRYTADFTVPNRPYPTA